MEHPEVMSVKQAAQYLGVSPDLLYKYVDQQGIPAFKLGNRWKFKKTLLDQWMIRECDKSRAFNKGRRNGPAS